MYYLVMCLDIPFKVVTKQNLKKAIKESRKKATIETGDDQSNSCIYEIEINKVIRKEIWQ